MKNNFNRFLPWLVGFGSIMMMLWQFVYSKSLWIDEAKLALNIIDKNYHELLQPLNANQVAPILFLWIEKLFTQLFGVNEIGFRLFPLLCGLGIVIVGYKVIYKLVRDPLVALMTYAMLCFNYNILYYANEVKQYSLDVLITLVLYYLALKKYPDVKSKTCLLLITGVVAIFLSNITVIILCTLSAYLIGSSWFKNKRIPRNYLLVIISWGLVFLLYYSLFIAGHPMREDQSSMMAFWQYAFPPSDIFSTNFLEWFIGRFDMVFNRLLFFPSKFKVYTLFGICYLFGILLLLYKRKYKVLGLVTLPIVIHLVLAFLKLYPFELRVMLYTIPLFLLVISYAIVEVLSYMLKSLKQFKKILPILILIPAIQMARQIAQVFPIEKEDFKSCYEFMGQKILPEDAILIYNAAGDPYNFYKNTGYFQLKNNIIFTEFHREDFSLHEKKLAQLKGRVWVLVTHDYAKSVQDRRNKNTEAYHMINYLKTKGEQKEFAMYNGSMISLIIIE